MKNGWHGARDSLRFGIAHVPAKPVHPRFRRQAPAILSTEHPAEFILGFRFRLGLTGKSLDPV
jgi:hypothetical protein